MYPEYLAHYGVKGMKWGKRKKKFTRSIDPGHEYVLAARKKERQWQEQYATPEDAVNKLKATTAGKSNLQLMRESLGKDRYVDKKGTIVFKSKGQMWLEKKLLNSKLLNKSKNGSKTKYKAKQARKKKRQEAINNIVYAIKRKK